MAILVTGGAGYIGSHTCVELQNAGYDVVVLDNLSNSSEKSLDRVKAITGKDVKFYKGDILDRDILNKIFENEKCKKVKKCQNFIKIEINAFLLEFIYVCVILLKNTNNEKLG